MKNQYRFCALFFILIGNLLTYAQQPNKQSRPEVEIFKKELLATNNDTTKIRLRFLIGTKSGVDRLGYWDSLVIDAHKCKALRFEGKALTTLGYYYWRNALDNKALECYKASYRVLSESGNVKDVFSPLRNLTSFYITKNNINKALEYCYLGLKNAEELADKEKINLLSSLAGNCYFTTGQINRALSMHQNCLVTARELKNDELIMRALIELGSDYMALKQKDSAAKYYIYTDGFVTSLMNIDINNSIAAGYNALKQYDSAYKYGLKANVMANRSKIREYIVGTMTNLAGINFENGRTEEAKKIAEEALVLVKTIHYPLQTHDLAFLLKQIYIKDKDYKKALEVYELYISTKDSIASDANKKQTLEKEFNYNLEKKENENKLLAFQLRQDKFILFGMGTLVLLAIIITYLFLRQNKLKDEQKSMQLEQKLLRSQMNPHFIFNSLQAIQNFVLKEDKKQAENYLSSFAGVMRNVLENSRIEAIPLNKEINLLTDYLGLQQLRFNKRFDYEININGGIDVETMLIAPMLGQPFIENAVEHGFHDIETGGKIWINYSLKKNGLVLEITDNGVGIKDAYSHKNHHSLAIEITRERIALMNKKAKVKAFFSIGDAFPEKERKGVKVIFILPQIS